MIMIMINMMMMMIIIIIIIINIVTKLLYTNFYSGIIPEKLCDSDSEVLSKYLIGQMTDPFIYVSASACTRQCQ